MSYIDYTDLRKGTIYYNLYCIWINFVFASFIPFILLLYFNISIANKLNSRAKKKTKLRRSNRSVYWILNDINSCYYLCPFGFESHLKTCLIRYFPLFSPICRKRETRLTHISLMIVWLFMFCHIWKLIPTLYEVLYGEANFEELKWLKHINNISHVLIVLNSSVNFLIYVVF